MTALFYAAALFPCTQTLTQVVKLRAVWQFAALLLTYRLGMLVAESAFSLKLIDKGVPKETLAALVLFQVRVWASRF